MKRRPTGEHLVENRAQAVDVARRAEFAAGAGGLLGGHVGRRAENRAREREVRLGLDPFGQAEIRNMRPSVGIDQNIRGLQIAMQNAALVRVMDSSRDWREERRGLARRQRPFGQASGEGRAGHELHREIGLPLVIPDFINRHNRRMIEPGRGFGLGAKRARSAALAISPRSTIFSATIRSRLICRAL